MGSILVSSAIALVLWSNFAYKLRRFRGYPRNDTQRANFATLLCMAVAFTILDPPVYAAIDAVTGVPNLARLLGNDCGVAGACAFEPVAAAVAKRTGRGGGVWGNWWFMGATLIIMTILFVAARLPISEPTAGFPVRYDAVPAVAAYRLVFLGAIGLTLCRLFVLWRRVSVAAAALPRPIQQRQARLQTVGWALGAGYCGYECAYVLLRGAGVASPMLYSPAFAYGLLAGCFALVLNDGFFTAWRWMDHYRAYYELGPLWHALVAAFPDLALDSPHRSSMRATVFGDLDFQLYRRTTEIRDGVMTLQPFLDQSAHDRAHAYYRASSSTWESARGDVEALTLVTAIAAKQQGARAGDRLAEPLLSDATDFDTDLRHLRAVAAAYRRLSPEEIVAVTPQSTDSVEDTNKSTVPTLTTPIRSQKAHMARVLTEVFAPSPVGVVALVIVAWRFSPTSLDAAKWMGVSAAFVVLLPLAHLLWRVWRGQITDIHVRQRDQRLPVILVFLASWCVGIVTLIILGAPHQLVALIGAGMTALVVTGLITLRWKISLHVGVAAGVLTVFAILFGPGMLLAAPLIPVLGWARVTLGDHTPWQVTAGACIGAIVSGAAFATALNLLR